MPLLKRKPYTLKLPPQDLKPDELVYQVRFTKEIFRDYEEYLNSVNLYRRRVWMCKVTGKTNLTFEEALISERKATEKVQQFPKEFMGPVLSMVQFSPLRIDELVDRIYKEFKDRFVLNEEAMGKYGDKLCACKILKVLQEQGAESLKYDVTWIGESGKKLGSSIELSGKLSRKKYPFTRALLKAFIRESSSNGPSRNSVWIVHNKLARKYKILGEPSERLKLQGKQYFEGEKLVKAEEVENGGHNTRKRQRRENHKSNFRESKTVKKALIPEPKLIHYPIEDSLVEPAADDPCFTERPIPSTDFVLPMECLGKFLMLWDFCCSFGKALQLSPCTIEEFEKSLDYREGDPPLLVEIHLSLLQTALSDTSLREEFGKKRKRRTEVSFNTWKEDLSDFLDLTRLGCYSAAVRAGYYRDLEIFTKLDILHELVDRCLSSSRLRAQLDENIEEHQAIAARKREAEVGGSKRRKKKQESAENGDGVCVTNGIGAPENAQDPDGSADEREVFLSLDQVGMKELGLNGGDGHAIGWKTKGKRKSVGNHSPVNTNGCVKKEDNVETEPASMSRHSILKQKEALKLAEEEEKDRKRSEENKKLQDKRKGQADAIAERKAHEQLLVESQKKQEQLDRELEKHFIRTSPLGKDRDYNIYWFFHREGRLFVESKDSDKWGYFSAKEEFDALYGSLNPKGIRERALQKQMEKNYTKISTALQRRSREMAQKMSLEEAVVRRSVRVKSAPRLTGFLAYTNKFRPM